MDKEIIIKPHFVFKDYFKVNLYLFTNSINGAFSLIIILSVLVYGTYFYSIGSLSLTDLILLLIYLFVIIPIVYLLINFIKTKRTLADPRLKEDITFKINKTNFIDFGQSYSRIFTFTEMLKIIETKHFFLFYITKHMVKVVRKADLKDNQYNELKAILVH